MNATQTLQQWFDQAGQSLPGLTMGALLLCITVGVLLWLAGGKLAKPAMVVGGLVMGLVIGSLASPFIESTGVLIATMLGLAAVGAILAGATFRLWMALSAAVVLAAVVPASMLIWQNTSTTQITGPGESQPQSERVQEEYQKWANQLTPQARQQVEQLIAEQSPASLASADQILQEQASAAVEALKGIIFENIESMQLWWEQNTSAQTRMALWGMLGGALVGMLIGIIVPMHAAALQSAMIGAVLIFVPGRELVMGWAPPAYAEWMPITPRGTLLALGLITAVGFSLQWMLYLKPDDK